MFWVWVGPLLQGITSSFKSIESEKTTKILENLEFNQLALELQDQEKFLEEQNTEMRVSKDAMSKYSTLWWISTILIGAFAIAGISYWVKQGVDSLMLKKINNTPQQEQVVDDTQESIQHTFVIDTVAIIDFHKEKLSADELEEFEQFPQEKQREYATENNK